MIDDTTDPNYSDPSTRRKFIISGATIGGNLLFVLKAGHLQKLSGHEPNRLAIKTSGSQANPLLAEPLLVALPVTGAALPAADVSYRYEFGLALHERAFQKVGDALRRTKPELFAHKTDVVVKQPSLGNVGNTLTLYSITKSRLLFDFSPIASVPSAANDTYFAAVDIEFSLTDSQLGTVTKIGATLQALGSLAVFDQVAHFSVQDFKIARLWGAHPDVKLLATGIDAGAAIAKTWAGAAGDDALGRTFRAIVNYLIQLFLADALKKTITEFPVPPIHQLLKVPALDPLLLQEVRLRNNSLYAMVGRPLDGNKPFPSGIAGEPDLAVGITSEGANRILSVYVAKAIPFQPNPTARVSIATDARDPFRIDGVRLNMIAGASTLPVQANIAGVLLFRFRIPNPFGGDFIVDLPFPIDRITGYYGGVTPTVVAEDLAKVANASVRVRVEPVAGLFDQWAVVVATDYRGYFSKALRDAVNSAADRIFSRRKFCKIPFIGWLICGIISVTAQVIGWIVGAGFDILLGAVLTGFLNTVGRTIVAFIDLNREVATLPQADLVKILGLPVKAASLDVIDNGRNGELLLSAWFDDHAVPPLQAPSVTSPTLPSIPADPPRPIPVGLIAHTPIADGAFVPALSLTGAKWPQLVEFTGTVQHAGDVAGSAIALTVTATLANGRWHVEHTAKDEGGSLSTRIAEYDDNTGAPRTSKHVSSTKRTLSTTEITIAASEIIDYTATPNAVRVRLAIGDELNLDSGAIARRPNTNADVEDLWVFRLAASSLNPNTRGILTIVDMTDPSTYVDWAREVPLSVEVSQESVTLAGKSIPAFKIVGRSDGRTTTAFAAVDGSGILTLNSATAEGSIAIVRKLPVAAPG